MCACVCVCMCVCMRVFPGSAVAQSAPGSLRVAHVHVAMEGTLLAGCGDSGQHPGGQRSLGSLRLIMSPFPPMRPRSLPRPPPRAAPVTDTQKDQGLSVTDHAPRADPPSSWVSTWDLDARVAMETDIPPKRSFAHRDLVTTRSLFLA